jgi:TPR repeat protein
MNSNQCSGNSSVPNKAETKIQSLKRRADAGDAKAQYYLGWRYANGKGVPQNYEKAVSLYLKAAEQGGTYAP